MGARRNESGAEWNDLAATPGTDTTQCCCCGSTNSLIRKHFVKYLSILKCKHFEINMFTPVLCVVEWSSHFHFYWPCAGTWHLIPFKRKIFISYNVSCDSSYLLQLRERRRVKKSKYVACISCNNVPIWSSLTTLGTSFHGHCGTLVWSCAHVQCSG